jgi:hypothetical protein
MSRARAAVLLFLIVIVGAIALLPVVRDELSWWLAESRDHAADFMAYVEIWPNGRHVNEARLMYKQRQWVETEKALIHRAYQEASHVSPDADAEYRKEKRLRRESFFWKAATNTDTLQSYQDYVTEFPQGQFTRQARARIATFSRETPVIPGGSVPAPQ